MNRKSVCIMAITGLVLTALGCGNDAHDIEKPPVHLLYTEPADNETIFITDNLAISIRLFFDRAPRSVTIHGKKAKIGGNTAKWEDWLRDEFFDNNTGIAILHIDWVNPDGSQGEGAVITLYVIGDDGYGPSYVSGTFDFSGNENQDPDVLNRDGIVMVFDETVFASSLWLGLGDSLIEGKNLNWTQTVEGKKVRLERLNGERLQFNQTYIIGGTVRDQFDYKTEMRIIFTTKESAVEPEDDQE